MSPASRTREGPCAETIRTPPERAGPICLGTKTPKAPAVLAGPWPQHGAPPLTRQPQSQPRATVRPIEQPEPLVSNSGIGQEAARKLGINRKFCPIGTAKESEMASRGRTEPLVHSRLRTVANCGMVPRLSSSIWSASVRRYPFNVRWTSWPSFHRFRLSSRYAVTTHLFSRKVAR